MHRLGVALLVVGIAVAVLGAIVLVAGRLPWLGRLPGDLHIERGNWTFYFPLGTSLLVSVVLTLLLWLVGRR